MTIDLVKYKTKTHGAVKAFWRSRQVATIKQKELGKLDQGEIAGVTSGKNMDGFIDLIKDIVCANGLKDVDVFQNRALLTLPGFFRPTKVWDLLVVCKGILIAAEAARIG